MLFFVFSCLCVGIDLRDFNLFLMHSYACLDDLFLRGFHGDCVGITHPWIGKKWPCTGVGP